MQRQTYHIFSVLSRHTYRLPFKIGLIAAEYMLPIFYATIPDLERFLNAHIYYLKETRFRSSYRSSIRVQ